MTPPRPAASESTTPTAAPDSQGAVAAPSLPSLRALPIDDPERLRALDATGLLGSGTDAAFDRLARLTSSVLGVPVAYVSLIDGDRQYFKSQVGLPEPWGSQMEMPLEHAFCQYVVRDAQELVVEDARTEDVTAAYGPIHEVGVVAYAGVPLAGADGYVLGSLCAIDVKPREWTEAELDTLRDLAAGVISEIELRRALANQQFYEPLTGLPNRALLLDRATQLLRAGDEAQIAVVALCVADLCGIGQINEVDGRDAGDALIREAARVLIALEDAAHTVTHLGGDRFAVLARVGGAADAATLGSRVAGLLDTPLGASGRQLAARLGIAVAGEGNDRAPALLEAAEAACARAKLGPQGTVELYGGALRAETARRLNLEGELRRALEREQLQVVYQPIVDLRRGNVRAVEALLRWEHPELGSVSPAEFIPVAERTGLIGSIGAWVLEQACADVANLNHSSGERPIDVSVNLSPCQIEDAGLASVVAGALERSGLNPARLILELTEGVLMDHLEDSTARLPELSAMGIRLAVDDFGTGYSSLSYLTRFPLDIIKLDRSFISGLEEDTQVATVVRTVLGLAAGLGMDVVAEGIETEEQARYLRRLDCAAAQGFLFSRPVSLERLPGARAGAEALTTADEEERVRALIAYDIIDTAPEQVFDDLARLAAELCGTSSGYINLIDDRRQFTKAAHGAAAEEVSLEESFCAAAIERPSRTLVVEDASRQERWRETTAVRDGARFYAGAPLVNADGLALGTLCVLDDAPGELTPSQIRALESLARLTVDQLEIRRHARLLREETVARRDAEQRLTAILEQAPDAFVAMDEKGFVVEWNAQAELMFGYTRAQALGHPVSDLIVPAEQREAHRAGLLRFARTGSGRIMDCAVELEAVCRDGRRLPVEMTISTVRKGEAVTITGFLRDISERRRAQGEAGRTLADLRVMGEVTRTLSVAPDLPSVGDAVVGAAATLAGEGALAILACPDEENGDLAIVASTEPAYVGTHLALNGQMSSVAAEAFRAGESRFVHEGAKHPDWAHGIARRTGARSAAYEPLRSEGETRGVLVVAWPEVKQSLPARLRPLLALLAADGAAALGRIGLLARLEHAASTDPLTGLWNRGVWARELPLELRRAAGAGHPVTAAILDLDHFKAFNDRHGHQAGDRLLREAAAAWSDNLRSSDLLARYGGEEFALLLPGCAASDAAETLRRLRLATPLGQTCSVGLAEWNGSESADTLMARADAALYEAKRQGRDRVAEAAPAAVA